MRIIMAGAGRIAINVATALLGQGHHVTIIDTDAELTRAAFEKHGLVALTGDSTEPSVLKDAGLDRADIVVAMLPRDADNLAVAVHARQAGVKRVLVCMLEPSYRQAFERVGVERILSETEIVIGAFATSIEHEAVLHAMPLGAGDSLAFELVIPEGSAVAGQKIMDIATHPDFPRTSVFAGVYQADGTVEAPRGSTVLQENRAVLLVARRQDLAKVVEFMRAARTSPSPAKGGKGEA